MTAEPTLPFEIVDGSVVRAGSTGPDSLAGRLRRIPGVGPILDLEATAHVAAALRTGRLVRETPRFVANELRGAPGLRAYTMRDGGGTVLLRHGRVDVWTFMELFLLRLYEPPAVVADALRELAAPTVLDLGANIGMFGLDALRRWPGAMITGYEPDAESAAIHRRLLERNGAGDRWTLIEACAGPRAGTVTFLPGQETGSHVVDGPVPGAVTVPMRDVLPDFAAADLVKIDIEGGEWSLLADSRFGTARFVVMEYHPEGCPGPDTHACARELLERHGYEVMPLFSHPGGVGMIWAYQR